MELVGPVAVASGRTGTVQPDGLVDIARYGGVSVTLGEDEGEDEGEAVRGVSVSALRDIVAVQPDGRGRMVLHDAGVVAGLEHDGDVLQRRVVVPRRWRAGTDPSPRRDPSRQRWLA